MFGTRVVLNLLSGLSLALIALGAWDAIPDLALIAAGMFGFIFFAFGPRRPRSR